MSIQKPIIVIVMGGLAQRSDGRQRPVVARK
jgi:hypothetical protein